MTKFFHYPALDGLRGLAVLLVMVAHFNSEQILKDSYPVIGPIFNKLLLMGLTGVDLFFVLSGFLITKIVITYANKPGFLFNFYMRRFLRIFPLYYMVLTIIFFVLPLLFVFDAPALKLKNNQLLLWTYLGNLPLIDLDWNGSDMFRLGHFWSLAVEEHFYLLWPGIILLFNNYIKRICYFWAGASFMVGIYIGLTLEHKWILLNWTTIHHSGGLAIGGLCAVLTQEQSLHNDNGKRYFKMFVFFVLFVGLSFIPRRIIPRLEIFIYPFASLFYYYLLLSIVHVGNKGLLSNLFNNRWLKNLGTVSYGMYLYHGILLPTFEMIYPRAALIKLCNVPSIGIVLYFILTISTTYVIAWLSWHVFEKQLLKFKCHFDYNQRDTAIPSPIS